MMDDLWYPRTIGELATFMDELSAAEDVRVRFRLGPAKRAASEAQDTALLEAIEAEGNAFIFFGDPDSLSMADVEARAYFNDGMMAYLRKRLESTGDQRLYTRYAHVIAEYSADPKDQSRAVDAYVATVEYYLSADVEDKASEFHGLRKLLPSMFATATKYGWGDRIMDVAVQAVQTPNPYLRMKLLELIVDDPGAEGEILERIRPDVFRTVNGLRASPNRSDPETMAELGMRLDQKVGRDDRVAWLRILAETYDDVARESADPFVKHDSIIRAAMARRRLEAEPQ